jgi:hypothetical protein
MPRFDLDQLLALLSVLLAAVVLPPAAAVPVLTFVVGLLSADKLRNPRR